MNHDDNGMYEHPFDSGLKVFPVPEDMMSDALRTRFAESHAFLVRGLFDHPTVVIDGRTIHASWFTDDHLSVILAHELAHHILGPMHGENPTDEIEADWLAGFILLDHGKVKAKMLLDSVFADRYGCTMASQRTKMIMKGVFKAYQNYYGK